jgi:magnesium chelatase subunit I
MTDQAPSSQPTANVQEEKAPSVGSLKELIDRVSGRGLPLSAQEGDAGLAEALPFPFLALVGQMEMKLALILSLVNPAVGGVLLIGPRGTGKTTAVRSLIDLLPKVPRSLCYHGCMPEDIEAGGIDAVCPECARKYGMGEPLAVMDSVRLVELPLNSRLDDVVGGIDERSAIHERLRLRRGILAQADRNLLYVDEVNLLIDEVVDAILDAAAQGIYTVRRGPVSATYRSRFVLIGSMNPEEGGLRPQILDRFGLRVLVTGPKGENASQERLEVYRRVQAYTTSPRRMAAEYSADTALAKAEIQAARDILPAVTLSDEAANIGLAIIDQLGIDSLRAAITLFEAARAYAAIDARLEVTSADLREVAPMALRLRRSTFMKEFFEKQEAEEKELFTVLDSTLDRTTPLPTAKKQPEE